MVIMPNVSLKELTRKELLVEGTAARSDSRHSRVTHVA